MTVYTVFGSHKKVIQPLCRVRCSCWTGEKEGWFGFLESVRSRWGGCLEFSHSWQSPRSYIDMMPIRALNPQRNLSAAFDVSSATPLPFPAQFEGVLRSAGLGYLSRSDANGIVYPSRLSNSRLAKFEPFCRPTFQFPPSSK